MNNEAMFTLKLEQELRDAFMAEAAASYQPASQIVRAFMRDFVRQQQATRAHDAWLLAEVEQGVREADDPAVTRVSHDEVAAKWRRQRAALVKRVEERTG